MVLVRVVNMVQRYMQVVLMVQVLQLLVVQVVVIQTKLLVVQELAQTKLWLLVMLVQGSEHGTDGHQTLAVVTGW